MFLNKSITFCADIYNLHDQRLSNNNLHVMELLQADSVIHLKSIFYLDTSEFYSELYEHTTLEYPILIALLNLKIFLSYVESVHSNTK